MDTNLSLSDIWTMKFAEMDKYYDMDNESIKLKHKLYQFIKIISIYKLDYIPIELREKLRTYLNIDMDNITETINIFSKKEKKEKEKKEKEEKEKKEKEEKEKKEKEEKEKKEKEKTPQKEIIPVSTFICNTFGNSSCNKYGLKISNALIRIAATRIFSEPEQSVMELVANSIDSYNTLNGLPSIGKFGMGFFSILYWLTEVNPVTKKYCRYMEIYSDYYKNPIKKTKIKSYKAILKWSENGLIMEMKKGDKSPTTGTTIIINSEEYRFKDIQLSNMQKEINKMFNVNNIVINLDGENINRKINENIKDVINITLLDYELYFSDNAQGIPPEVLYNSLLIPSSSSKTRAPRNKKYTLHDPEIIPHHDPKKIKELFNELHIIINSVSVVNITIENTENDSKKEKSRESYIIYLPNDSILPVSRDDIIYGKIESKYFKKQLWKLINIILTTNKNLITLFNLLDKYLLINKQENLFKVIMEIKNELLEKDYILIPNTKFWIKFVEIFEIKNYALYQYSDKFVLNKQLYNILLKVSRDDIFKMRLCISFPLEDGNLINDELPSFLFINCDLDNEKEIVKVMSSSSDTLLIPIKDELNITLNSEQKDIINKFKNPKKIENIYKVLQMTIFKKFQNVEINKSYFLNLFKNFCFFCNYDDTNDIINFLYFLNSKISSIKLNFTYGTFKKINIFSIDPLLLPLDYLAGLENNNDSDENIESLNICNYINKKLFNYMINLYNESASVSYWLPGINYFILPYHILKLNDDLRTEYISSVNKCITSEELFIFTYTTYKFITFHDKINTLGIFEFLLSEIRRKYTNSTLYLSIKNYMCNFIDSLEYFKSITDKDLLLSMEEYYNNLNFDNYFTLPIIDEKYKFSCKSLLTYIFNNSFEDLSTKELFSKVSKSYKTYEKGSTKLQIVEIAVNEGTTKPFVQAIITELVQNSVDAIKSNFSSISDGEREEQSLKKSGDDNIDKKKNEIFIDTANNAISISDCVGISNLNSIISLLIPFLSSKDPNDPNVTGEMGTGFFNVYRQPYVEKVYIITTSNESTIKIECVPLIENGVVYDIEYRIEIEKDTFFSTSPSTSPYTFSERKGGHSNKNEKEEYTSPGKKEGSSNKEEKEEYTSPGKKEGLSNKEEKSSKLKEKNIEIEKEEKSSKSKETKKENGTKIIIILKKEMPDIINDVNVYVNTKIGFSENNGTITNEIKSLYDDIEIIRASSGRAFLSKKGIMNKEQLQEKCRILGIKFSTSHTKAELIEKIEKSYEKFLLIHPVKNITPVKNNLSITYKLNSKDITKTIKSVYKIENVGEVFYSIDKIPSLLMTNNSAFCNLKDFVVDYDEIYPAFNSIIGNSIIINLDKSFYKPNQSRTKINIENRDMLIKLINNGIYFIGLYMYVNNYTVNPNDFIPFTDTTTNVSQLKIFDSDVYARYDTCISDPSNYKIFKKFALRTLFVNYSIAIHNIPLCSYINAFIDNYAIASTVRINTLIHMYPTIIGININELSPIINKLQESFNNKTIISLYKTVEINKINYTFDIGLIISVLSKWFKNKDTSISKVEKIIISKKVENTGKIIDKNGKTINKIDEKDAKIKWDHLQIFTNIYWRKLKILISSKNIEGITFNTNPPVILSGKSSNNYKGYYSRKEHCIVMNSDYYNPDLFLGSISKIKKLNIKESSLLLQTDSELFKYFASNMSTTFIHELGHAIQGTDHIGSSHGLTNIKFKGGKVMEFDDMCLEIYKKIIMDNLFSEYIEELKDIL